jgi:queuine tRNA-ribosyltransferase
MPVGTRASVKALAPDDLKASGAQVLLANTYHLMLRPGADAVQALGGLHGLMAWPGPILTDSGGFQVFSLRNLRKISREGLVFRSTYDGSEARLDPELAVSIQTKLDPDIMMCLDECTGYPASREEARASMDLTLAWAERCRKAWPEDTYPALFGISQGGFYPDLRAKSARDIAALGFPGQAAGGLALGEPRTLRLEAIEASFTELPPDKPRYLMGLGTPLDLLDGVRLGADMFDCVMPTRNARNGQLFTREGKLNILNSRYKEDRRPLDEACRCYACRNFSRGYLRLLLLNREPLFPRLASLHNLTFYADILEGARWALLNGSFPSYYKELSERWI